MSNRASSRCKASEWVEFKSRRGDHWLQNGWIVVGGVVDFSVLVDCNNFVAAVIGDGIVALSFVIKGVGADADTEGLELTELGFVVVETLSLSLRVLEVVKDLE